MAAPWINAAFALGELAPDLWGRVDLARFHVGSSTVRNAFVRYQGGISSRPGTRFVGFSKQTGRAYPPRLIPFQFNVKQALVLEFGHEYMRVIRQGAFVTENPVNISGITQASPGVVTVASVIGGVSAVAITSGVVVSYAPGDRIALAGGTFQTRAVLEVSGTFLKSLSVNEPGTGYAPADTIDLAGGVQSTTAVVTVDTTKVVGVPTIAAAGAGGTPGVATVAGTTGTGTPFQAQVTISGGGAITSVNSLVLAGSYTVNPTTPATEPVVGGGLVGAQLAVELGVDTISITNAGVFTENPAGGDLTQGATSGAGTDATFNQGLFAPNAAFFSTAGSYTSFPGNPVSQFSTTGLGRGATWTVTSGAVAPFDDGNWVVIEGVNGMTQVNGETFVVNSLTTTTFELYDVYGNPVDTTNFSAYVGSGTAARIFTLDTPYQEQDLPWIKFTQSADVMTLCCLNQDTSVEYQPQDLARLANDSWELEPVVPESSIAAPTGAALVASAGGAVNYQYVVTSIDPENGTESVASGIAGLDGAVNITATAGTITVSWNPVQGVQKYNVYKAPPGYGAAIPLGVLFGYAGSAYGVQFIDSNIVPDFSQVPPQHRNPFARGQIVSASPVAGGAGYSTISLTINSSTGSGGVLTGVLIGGALAAIIVANPGQDYEDGDTITVSGDGAGATATLEVGPQSGTYPSTVAYFQQRRVFANSLNNPDTYNMSQPGAFGNFDKRDPTLDDDAITGNPWSVQVNGIQFMLPMPGGLVVFTGEQAWQLTGAGGSSLNPQAITPSSQQAQPQEFNGISPIVPPVQINQEIIYVQHLGSVVRDLSYNYFTNIYTGSDLTLNSSHLFTGRELTQVAWCEEPFKLLWYLRDDGTLLCLTFIKQQEIAGWSRHDTNGEFVSICTIPEPPTDALYLATRRFPGEDTAYMIERMDDRIWPSIEDAWCVDAGLRLAQPMPDATLRVSSAAGLGAVTGGTIVDGGAGWASTSTGIVVDDNAKGPGTGAVPTLGFTDGVLTSISFAPGSEGTGYIRPKLVVVDMSGTPTAQIEVELTLDNSATATADANVFQASDEGSVIRAGGGVMTISNYVSPTEVEVQITSPIVDVVPNTSTPFSQATGDWTMTAPVSSVGGLRYLAGATVTGTYDGKVLSPTVVGADGFIDLPEPATAVTIGLGFTMQHQTVYLDVGNPTIQGLRKKIAEVIVRIRESREFFVGANQQDGSALSPPVVGPRWQVPQEVRTDSETTGQPAPYNSETVPMFTGDLRVPIPGGWAVHGQVATEQSRPLPLTILAIIDEFWPGDMPELEAKQRSRGNMGTNG